MATEKRLIDANELARIYKLWIGQLQSPEDAGDLNGVETCLAVLLDQPTVDAVEVVRCKDCLWATKDDDYGYWCNNPDLDCSCYRPAVGFCESGERKDNAKETV